jgi:DNA (cytosine-5)-methyltransferase 1
MGELLLDRLPTEQVRAVWPAVATFQSPEGLLQKEVEFRELTTWIDRGDRAEKLIEVARACVESPEALVSGVCESAALHGVGDSVTDLAVLAAPVVQDAEEPVLVTKGILRVARAYFGDNQLLDRQNRYTDGRLAVARLIGGAETARSAHLALLEIAADLCSTGAPECSQCPLRVSCATAPSK